MYRFAAIIVLASVFCSGVPYARGTERELSVTAQSMNTDAGGTITARGNVVVRGEGVTVRADRLSYDPGSETLILEGDVRMEEEGGGIFTGDTLALDLGDLTGGISRGEIIIVPNGFRVRGEDISRIGPEEYSIRKGVFTSCPGDCPDWSFTASRIQVQKEGYLKARHAAFRIMDVPVFYTPYLLYPVKTERQTGLLFPEIGFSEETGIESTWPLYVTLGSHADATFSPRTYSRDSHGLKIESRYRLEWGGGGEADAFTISGANPERWFVSARHAGALSRDVWVRWRWYDAGDAAAAALFGDDFRDRYPGAVYRHLSVEGDHGPAGYRMQASSHLADGTLARSSLPGTVLERQTGTFWFDPAGGDFWRAKVSADVTGFENGESRYTIAPYLGLRIPGPWMVSGDAQIRGILATDGRGTEEDESWLVRVVEKVAVESVRADLVHRMVLEVTASAAQGAAFTGSGVRDSRDLVQERKLFDARLISRYRTSSFQWDLTAGAWRDTEQKQSLSYGNTRLASRGVFLRASRNQDADFGLVLPSLTVDRELYEGWQVEAGYESDQFLLSVGRDSAEGFPETLRGRGRLTLGRTVLSAETFYDLDAGSVADETVNIRIPGRCWTVGLERSRTPDRTGWSLQLELGL